MDDGPDSENFYSALPPTRGFASVADPSRYAPLPDDWLIGVADVADSTRAVRENRYLSLIHI